MSECFRYSLFIAMYRQPHYRTVCFQLCGFLSDIFRNLMNNVYNMAGMNILIKGKIYQIQDSAPARE